MLIFELFKRFRSNKRLNISKTPFIMDESREAPIDFNHEIPIIKVSNVSGENTQFLRNFIDTLKPKILFVGDSLHFLIECVYSIKGIGFVVSGLVKSGKISVGSTYWVLLWKIHPCSVKVFITISVKILIICTEIMVV